MGQCASNNSGNPEIFGLERVRHLKIGESIESSTGCTPNIWGTQVGSGYDRAIQRGFMYPQNGEFNFILGSSCRMCSDVEQGYGCSGCNDWNNSIEGRRVGIQRISYGADKLKCCLGKSQNQIVDGKTCDPSYLPNSKNCFDITSEYCNNIDNFNNEPACLTFCSQNNGYCDNSMSSYCEKNPDAPQCFCINSTINKSQSAKKIGLSATCIDKDCVDRGYKTRQMIEARERCPKNFTNCQVINEIGSVGKSFTFTDNINTMNCGTNENNQEVPKIEMPKIEVPKIEVPKIEVPKIEMPKIEVPKIEVPKIEVPKIEMPKIEMPKSEMPKIEMEKSEMPKTDKTKLDKSEKSKEKSDTNDTTLITYGIVGISGIILLFIMLIIIFLLIKK